MDDWKIIWDSFCDEVAASVQKNNLEKVFEEDIARDFFTTLGWNRFKKELKEQYSVKFATATHRADFALFTQDKEKPEVIIELKRPKKKKEEKDANQLIDYMRQVACSYGVLLLGQCMEIYFIDYSTPEHISTLVETIKYQHGNDAARQFMEVIDRSEYTPAKMLEYCHKRVKVNKSVEYWCSEDGKTELLNMIVERSKLETLRSTLIVDVKRKDGLSPIVSQPLAHMPENKPTATKPTNGREPNVWMISANPKFFDHRRCFEELGQIYWKQCNNLQVGDTGYIYLSKPRQEVVFKYEIIACDLHYSKDMDAEWKYFTNPKDIDESKKHNRFYLIKKIGESTSGKLTLEKMMQHGLKKPPLGAFKLSQPGFKDLLSYIESNF